MRCLTESARRGLRPGRLPNAAGPRLRMRRALGPVALLIASSIRTTKSQIDPLAPVPFPIEGLSACLSTNTSSQGRLLKYPDGTLHPVMIPFAVWASAQIVSQIAHILLSEVMGYSVLLLDNTGKDSGQPVLYAAGCLDILDLTCAHHNILRPTVHFTVETWSYGIGVQAGMPADIQPALLSLLDYYTHDATYLWEAVVLEGTAQRQALDDYEARLPAFASRAFPRSGVRAALRNLLMVPLPLSVSFDLTIPPSDPTSFLLLLLPAGRERARGECGRKKGRCERQIR